ncbi:MAG: malto-oligosyltrehalose trehalohydrolase [Thermodesulfobacteriota bacterium]
MMPEIGLGATYLGGGKCTFCVWAPLAENVAVHILDPQERMETLLPRDRGYHVGNLEGVEPGALYMYGLNGEKERPDPASRSQPQGVHGPSQVVDSYFPWEDGDWRGIRLRDYILYELHVGTFTQEGTFDAVVPHLERLRDLGITAIELMPVAQFPGSRNWGYDGVYPFAVQNSYGGPEGLKRLVNASHARGIAIVLDVVCNHLGPEGNYLWDFGPYFADRYRTPWGPAINFDGPYSDEVRRFFIENALSWVTDFHIDALRIDAIHGIFDFSARHFLEELGRAVHERADALSRRVYVIPESDLNDSRVIRPREVGGYGLDAQWNDDFHHAVHTLLTDERTGYYQDFGRINHLAKALREGFVYSGQYSPYRRQRHGNSSMGAPDERFVVFSQNHDQVGNRVRGDRLSTILDFESLKLAAGAVLLSPFIPLLFMGEEYAETATFPYFVSHSDPDLIEAVRRGRGEEFVAFKWEAEPPDPQAIETFEAAKLRHDLRSDGFHRVMHEFYAELIALRGKIAELLSGAQETRDIVALEHHNTVLMVRSTATAAIASLFHFGQARTDVPLPLPAGQWRKLLDSAAEHWNGPGSVVSDVLHSDGELALSLAPHSVVLLVSELFAST